MVAGRSAAPAVSHDAAMNAAVQSLAGVPDTIAIRAIVAAMLASGAVTEQDWRTQLFRASGIPPAP